MGYVIAAYAIVLGGLLAYGSWVQAQRRVLIREAERRGAARRESA